jgi:hypothetical protein
MYPDSFPLMEELEGQKKLPAFCELMDKRTQVASQRLNRPFPDPLYRTVVQTPMTSSVTSRLAETITPVTTQRKQIKSNDTEVKFIKTYRSIRR